MSLSVWIAGCSERHVRQANQDRIFPASAKEPLCVSLPTILAVADGMGGTEHGEQAAEIATAFLPPFSNASSLTSPELQPPANWSAFARPAQAGESKAQQWLQHYFRYVNHTIVRQLGGAGVAGSTLSLLRLEEEQWHIGHLGDSRVYLLREQRLARLTTDHNLFQKALEDGYLLVQPAQLNLTPEDRDWLQEQESEDAEFFYIPQPGEDTTALHCSEGLSQHLRQRFSQFVYNGRLQPVGRSRERLVWALGKEQDIPAQRVVQPVPASLSAKPQAGDLFLLCSDGLCGFVEEKALEQRLNQLAQQLREAPDEPSRLMWGVEMLWQDARAAESNDNVSIVLGWITSSESNEMEVDTSQEAPIVLHPSSTKPSAETRTIEHQQRRSSWEVEPLPVMTPHQETGQPLSPSTTLPPLGEKELSVEVQAPARTLPERVPEVTFELDESFESKPPSGTLGWLERLVWIALVICLLGLWLWPEKKPTPRPQPRTPVRKIADKLWKPEVPLLLWSRGPELKHDNSARQRLLLLQDWNLLFGKLQKQWALTPSARQRQQTLLSHSTLTLEGFQALLKKYSADENSRFERMDAQLRKVLDGWVEILLPITQNDEWSLWRKPPLPQSTPLSRAQSLSLRRERRALLLRLQKQTQPLFGPHWRVEWALLLVEMPTSTSRKKRALRRPWKPDPSTRRRFLKRCQMVLTLLKKQAPKDSTRSLLENWVQQLKDK
jgi:serine/threonine protein phosphatase PrpC